MRDLLLAAGIYIKKMCIKISTWGRGPIAIGSGRGQKVNLGPSHLGEGFGERFSLEK
jgi:hypothetical protein